MSTEPARLAGERPRRCVLYVPAVNARALAKAATLPCDAVILDLEDSVAPDLKEAARHAALDAVRRRDMGRREVVVRVNALGTPWHEADLQAAATAGADAVLVPKVDSPEHVRALATALERAGAPARTALWVMIETPAAVLRAADIAAAHDRLVALVVGTNDLVNELGAVHEPGRGPLVTALQHTVLAARAAGRVVLDGVCNDVRDQAVLEAECEQGRRFGFDGKTVIHPAQIGAANRAFSPTDDDVAQARGVLEAWQAGGGAGVVTYRGCLVEELHVAAAQRTLHRHAAALAGADVQR